MTKKTRKFIDLLFDKAKGSMLLSPSDPLIPGKFVTLYDMAYVCERLNDPKLDLDTEHRPEIYERLLDALVRQDLIARMLENNQIIPSIEWSSFASKGVAAFESGFLSGGFEFMFHEDLKLRDLTPVLQRSEAIAWIVEQRFSQPTMSGRPHFEGLDLTPRIPTEVDLSTKPKREEAYAEYYAKPMLEKSIVRPTVVEREDWIKNNLGVNRDRAREIESAKRPDEWNQKGRRPKRSRN